MPRPNYKDLPPTDRHRQAIDMVRRNHVTIEGHPCAAVGEEQAVRAAYQRGVVYAPRTPKLDELATIQDATSARHFERLHSLELQYERRAVQTAANFTEWGQQDPAEDHVAHAAAVEAERRAAYVRERVAEMEAAEAAKSAEKLRQRAEREWETSHG